MSVIKEFREFFLRAISVSSGTKPDQEAGFPTQYTVNGKTVFNRFLKKHFPSEDVFKKLFESVTFKLNPEDTATEDEQGLVKRATQLQFDSGAEDDGNGKSLYATPAQIQAAIATGGYDDTALQAQADSNTAAIGVNAGNISTNAGDIGTNASDIATHETRLDSIDSQLVSIGGLFTVINDTLNTWQAKLNSKKFVQDIMGGLTQVNFINTPGLGAALLTTVFDASNDHSNVIVVAEVHVINNDPVIDQAGQINIDYQGSAVATLPLIAIKNSGDPNNIRSYMVVGHIPSYTANEDIVLRGFGSGQLVGVSPTQMSIFSNPNDF